jgi:hypothetical protein
MGILISAFKQDPGVPFFSVSVEEDLLKMRSPACYPQRSAVYHPQE